MPRTTVRTTLTAMTTAALLAAAPAAALAGGPERYTIPVDDPAATDTETCGFPIELSVTGTLEDTFWSDADSGMPERLIRRVDLTFTASTDAATVTQRTRVTEHVEYTDGIPSVRATGLHANVRGPSGPIGIKAGQSLDSIAGAPFIGNDLTGDELAARCDELAG